MHAHKDVRDSQNADHLKEGHCGESARPAPNSPPGGIDVVTSLNERIHVEQVASMPRPAESKGHVQHAVLRGDGGVGNRGDGEADERIQRRDPAPRIRV